MMLAITYKMASHGKQGLGEHRDISLSYDLLQKIPEDNLKVNFTSFLNM